MIFTRKAKAPSRAYLAYTLSLSTCMEKYFTKRGTLRTFSNRDMLASFQKFKTQNRKQGKTRKSDKRKKNLLKFQPFGEIHSASARSQVLELPEGLKKKEVTPWSLQKAEFLLLHDAQYINNSFQPFHEESW